MVGGTRSIDFFCAEREHQRPLSAELTRLFGRFMPCLLSRQQRSRAGLVREEIGTYRHHFSKHLDERQSRRRCLSLQNNVLRLLRRNVVVVFVRQRQRQRRRRRKGQRPHLPRLVTSTVSAATAAAGRTSFGSHSRQLAKFCKMESHTKTSSRDSFQTPRVKTPPESAKERTSERENH